jgi:triacylglycerol esterase/lipase EstA (alpha/beta hydrolase family)
LKFEESVTERANELKQFIIKVLEKYKVGKVHLLCHSMGGLDAKHMLWNNRNEHFEEKIASITTVGVYFIVL